MDKVTNRIPEWRLQASIAADLDRRIHDGQPFTYAASLEGVAGLLNPYQSQLAAAQGMQRGEPDLRLYFSSAHLVMIELKGENGKLTDSQKVRIPILRGLGFLVHIVHAVANEEAVALAGTIVDMELDTPGSSVELASALWWPRTRAGK